MSEVKRRGMVAFICILALVLCIYLLAEEIAVHGAPRLVLSWAIQDRLDTLEAQFANSPVQLLIPILDPQLCQRIDLRLDTRQSLLGSVHCDLRLDTQGSPKGLLAQGKVSAAGRTLDLSLYLNGEYAALSEKNLLGGNYYGITYDLFSQELRSHGLLALFLGQERMRGWEQSVEALREHMEDPMTLPAWDMAQVRTALLGILALKPQVADGEGGHTLTFRAQGSELAELAEPYRSQMAEPIKKLLNALKNDTDSHLAGTFFLIKGKITQLEGTLHLDDQDHRIRVQFQDQSTAVQLHTPQGLWSLTVTLEFREGTCREAGTLITPQGQETSWAYTWDPDSGELRLKLNDAQIRMTLTQAGEGITLYTQDLSALLAALTQKAPEEAAICTLTIAPGSSVTAPAYRSLGQWSGEDLLVLLQGFGWLLGLQLP